MYLSAKKTLIGLGLAFAGAMSSAQTAPQEYIGILPPSMTTPDAAAKPGPAIEEDDSKLSNVDLLGILKSNAPALERYAALRSLGIRSLEDKNLQPQVIEQFLDLMAHDPDVAMRGQALYWSGQIAEKAPAPLAQKIGHFVIGLVKTEKEDDNLASAAAITGAIAELHKPMLEPTLRAILPLVASAIPHQSGNVRTKTIRAIAFLAMRYPAAADLAFSVLNDGARDDKDEHARWQSVRSLGWIGERYVQHAAPSLDRLLDNLNNDTDPEIREQAITSIGAIGRKHSALAEKARNALLAVGTKGDEVENIRERARDESETIMVKSQPRKQVLGSVTPQ